MIKSEKGPKNELKYLNPIILQGQICTEHFSKGITVFADVSTLK